MKKLYSIAAAAIVSLGFIANAENIYISGAFNDNDPAGNEAWMMIPGDEEDGEANIYAGYFNIPEGECVFNFKMGDQLIVPTSGFAFENIDFTSNNYSTSFLVSDQGAAWSDIEWSGGELGIILDFNDYKMYLTRYEEFVDIWYIRGPFNDFNPDGDEKWALVESDTDEDNGLYIGEFAIPSGQLSFNLLSPAGTVFIPAAIAEEDFLFVDNVFMGMADYAYDEAEESYCWTNTAWEGGKISVSINANTGRVMVTNLGENTGIETFIKDENDGPVYNLQGLKVDKTNLKKGIYIIEGKKIFVK
ncbi:MAG: hypothetical protein J1D77_02175 [Muribaculaceae bacterium]|nr:hypothetical protein [Muribaculaceae bacterium]